MSQLSRTVAKHEKEHAELLKAIAHTEDVTDRLAAHERKVAEIEAQLEEIVNSEPKGKPRRKTLVGSPQPSIASKFSFLVRRSGNNLSERCLQDSETTRSEKQIRLGQALCEAKFEQLGLQKEVDQYHLLRQQLDDLYDVVFNGLTPGVPNEVELKQKVAAAQALCDRVSTTLMVENETFEYISKAENVMRECRTRLKEALESVAISMFADWRSGESYEALNLQTAYELARRVPYLVREAQRHSPDIRPLEELSITNLVLSRDEQSRDQYYTLIRNAATEVNRAHDQLSDDCKAFANRVTVSEAVIKTAQQTLSEYRRELRAIRQEIFEKARQNPNFGETVDPPPPSYDFDSTTSGFELEAALDIPSPLYIPNDPIGRPIDSPRTDATSPLSLKRSSDGSDGPASLPSSSSSPPTSALTTPGGRHIRPLPQPPVSLK
ncbi:hypothetical protein E1B28_001856 [Marasmius oreades]|uniref:Uncharacterized protein n=1 Tax=Marasmius oreades TaxID=181124 RepID=A0A9P7V4M1_9AGAR|nr:uncharacterized protein E1B28_001856 [Marasmius oreades]KAG7100072.1 hypothetical protein E1B28_001856 [Marasmius oreades]